MAEFSTTKITPTDDVKIPSVSGQVAGYQENDELKAYVLGNIPIDVSGHTADITGIRGTTDGYQESGKAYAIGDPCIQDNIVYVAKEAIADPAGTFDPTKWDQSDLVTLMLKAKENSDAITSLNTTVTNLGSLAIESKTSGRTLDQISSYLVDNLETLTPVKGRFYQYMVQFTASPSGHVHLQIGSRETGVGYGYAYSMDYVTLYYFTISGGTCYLRKVANA